MDDKVIKFRKPVTLTIDTDVIKEGKEQAIIEHRSFSNYVEWLIVNDIEEQKSINRLMK